MRAALGLLLALCALPAAAQSLGNLGFKMLNTEANPFEFWIDRRDGAVPPSVRDGTFLESAAQSAASTWDGVSCASTAFSFKGGYTAASASSSTDDVNVVAIWVRSVDDPAYDLALGGGAVAAASVPRAYSGVLSTCDVYLNAVDHNWSVASTTPANHLDVQSVLLHELGHCQGLADSFYDHEAVMYVSLSVGESRRTLTPTDRTHLCGWSPKSGQVGSPCTVGESCGATGLTCVAAEDTQGSSSYPVCSRSCSPQNPCAAPYVCTESTAIEGATSICLPPQGLVTAVGQACTTHPECGTAQSFCIAEDANDEGLDFWTGGYCTQTCGAGYPECPSGSTCEETTPGLSQCLQSCRIGSGDCREGYTCNPGRDGAPSVCIPRCTTDTHCGSGETCRTCDGTCIPAGRPGVQQGDACAVDADCGTSQSCIRLGDGDGICAQRCETACTACPTNSTCHQVNGERLCLRNCETASTCSTGLQCAPLEGGPGCFPRCDADTDCPVGNVCDANGQCMDPNPPDAGCGALCGHDGGTPPEPRPDGGFVSPPSGGCGCGAGVGGPAWILLTLLGGALYRLRTPRA